MGCVVTDRTISLFIILTTIISESFTFIVPNPTITAYTPRGLSVSIPDLPGIQNYGFHGQKSKEINGHETGDYFGEATVAQNGYWNVFMPNVKLDVGDVVHYWTSTQHNRLGYRQEHRKFEVTELKQLSEQGIQRPPPSPTPPTIQPTQPSQPFPSVTVPTPGSSCVPSQTTTSEGGTICMNSILFDENFRLGSLNKWITQNRISDFKSGPDFEFVSYRNTPDNVYFRSQSLHLKPIAETIEDSVLGELDLGKSCTSRKSLECRMVQEGAQILPPVQSGRINSKFSFRYGRVEIVAKMPKGDWIYPELYLEPKDSYYGFGYSSGRMVIAFSRGNAQLRNSSSADISDNRLYGGAVIGTKEDERQCTVHDTISDASAWSDDFHKYTLVWKPDEISVLVDDVEYGKTFMSETNFAQCAPKTVQKNERPWTTPSAPFDREFIISIGVGVGGVNDFPDNTTPTKPWGNVEYKAMYNFFTRRDNWLSSWRGDNSALKVRSVRVFAI